MSALGQQLIAAIGRGCEALHDAVRQDALRGADRPGLRNAGNDVDHSVMVDFCGFGVSR
jgi:hypothetical protein